VCHFQSILDLPQVMISKHLAYLRARKMVQSRRHEQWMIYGLPASRSPELELQLRCLQDCVQSDPIFKKDLARLKKVRCECDWIETVTIQNDKDGTVAKGDSRR
jgi:ArsR family transcriptional regulator